MEKMEWAVRLLGIAVIKVLQFLLAIALLVAMLVGGLWLIGSAIIPDDPCDIPIPTQCS